MKKFLSTLILAVIATVFFVNIYSVYGIRQAKAAEIAEYEEMIEYYEQKNERLRKDLDSEENEALIISTIKRKFGYAAEDEIVYINIQ